MMNQTTGQKITDNPLGKIAIVWENVLMLTIVYNFVTTCYFLGLPGFPYGFWTYIEFLTEAAMILDILIRFCILRYVVKNSLKKNGPWRQINMLKNKSDEKTVTIILMILSSLPTSIIMFSSLSSSQHASIWLAIIRIAKLYRLKQLYLYFDVRDIRSKKDSFIRTFEASLYILMVTHFLACLWLFIARVDPQQELTWKKLVKYDQYEDVSDVQKYVDSALFVVSSMTGLGFAFIYPRTNLEYGIQSLIMICGVSLYANFFAFFAVTIYNRNKKMIGNMLRYEESKELAVLRNFPTNIRGQSREYYNSMRLKFEQIAETYQIVEELPQNLQSEMSLYINSDFIQKVNFFQFADPAFILGISKCLRPEIVMEESYVVQRGEVASKMYFIKQGIVQVLATDNKTSIAFMSEGTYFGEIGVLLTQKRSCSIKASTCTQLFSIDKDDLVYMLTKYPLIMKYLKAVGKQRLETTHPHDISNEQDHGFIEAYRTYVNNHQIQTVNASNGSPINNHHFTMYTSQSDITSQVSAVPQQNRFARGKTSIREKYGIKWFLKDHGDQFENFIIIPFSKAFNIWSMVYTVVFTYNFLFVPFSIGLRYDITGSYIAIDIIAIVLTLVDSMLRPFLAINKNYDIVTERDVLVSNYLKENFALDALSTIPFDYLISIISNASGQHRYFRLLRLLKIYRLIEISSLIQRHTQVNLLICRIMILFFAYIIIAHWFNCSLLYFGMWEYNQNRRFDGNTLIAWLQKSSSVTLPPPELQTVWELYANMIVLAFCYMGSIVYGDIIPFTISEETTSLVEMLMGRVFIAFLFAEMSNYIQCQYQAYNNHIDERDVVLKWIEINGIQSELKDRIEKYFEIKWQYNKGIQEDELVEDLPEFLRKDIKNFFYDELIRNCDVFPRDDNGAITTISNKLKRVLIPKNEYIIKQGELAADMCFIMKGQVRVVTSEGQTLATLSKFKHFGEMALISDTTTVRSTSIIADSNVQLAVLSKDDFKLICQHYPHFKIRMQEIIDQRARDSQKKGVNIQTLPTEENLETAQDLILPRKSIAAQQLSIIQEETKRGDYLATDSIYNEIASIQSKQTNMMVISPFTNNFILELNQTQKHLSLPASTGFVSLYQPQKFGRAATLIQNDIISSSSEEGELKINENQSDEEQQTSRKFVEEKDNNEDDASNHKNVEIKIQNQDSSVMSSQKSQNQNAYKQKQIFEDSINQENETKNTNQLQIINPQVRFNLMSVSMKDIDKNSNSQLPESAGSPQNQNFLANPFENKSVITKEEQKDDKLSYRLKVAVKFSSSISNFEDYLQQYKENMGTKKATFVQMFAFYAFKYMIIFPISVYNMIFIPLQLGFSHQFRGWYLFMEIITIINYSFDAYLLLKHYRYLINQNQIQPDGMIQMEHVHDKDQIKNKIAHLKIDLFSSIIAIIPFSLIFQQKKSALFLINFLRVLRLMKIVPVYKVLQYFKRYNANLVRLIEIILSYYQVAHICSGVMLSIGLSYGPDISNTWLNKLPVPLPQGITKQNSTANLTTQTLYIHAIYFTANTISHVAIGDLTSVTLEERLLNAFMIWIFTFFYALLFANIQSMFTHGNSFLQFNERYQHVMSSIPSTKLSKEVITKINTYYEYLWATNHGQDEVKAVFNNLPRQMMYDAIRERFQESFEQAIIFKDDNDQQKLNIKIVNSFIEQMEIRVYMPKDFIIKAGSLDDDFYFVLDGNVLIFGLDDNLIGILSSGAHFSNALEEMQSNRQIVHLMSLSITTLAKISRNQMMMLYQAFPNWKSLIFKLNEFILKKARISIDHLMNHNTVDAQTLIQDHLAFSDFLNNYSKITSQLDSPKNFYFYDPNSIEYKKMNILNQQLIHIQNDNQNLVQRKSSRKMAKRTSSQSVLQFNLVQNQMMGSQELDLKSRFSCTVRFLNWRVLVEFLQLINLIYVCFSVPFSIAFLGNDFTLLFTITEAISIFYQWIFIIVKFRTPVIYIGGSTSKLKNVFLQYMKKGSLIMDILGALPLNLILCGIIKTENLGIFYALLRLTRMAAIFRLNEIYEKFQIQFKNHSIKIVSFKSFLIFYFVWHFTSCLWYFVNIMENEIYPITWAKQFNLIERTIQERYLLSLYYVIKIVTGLGQSDMIAYNDLERICFIIIINLGDAVFAITFGLIAEVQMHISENSTFQKYVSKMKEIESFLNFINANPSQKSRVEQYYSYENYLRGKRQILMQKDLEGYLPYSVLRDILYEVQKDTLEAMFKGFKSENLIRDLSFAMKTAIYMPGDFVITKDQEGEEMYFIIEGIVSVISGDQSTVIKTLTKGAYFGEVAIFMKIKRTANIQAKTPCILGILKRADIEKILQNFPKVAMEFISEANRRMKEMYQAFEESTPVPSQLQKSNDTFRTDQDMAEESKAGDNYRQDHEKSFINALKNKIGDIVDSQSSPLSDFTHRNMMKSLQKNSGQVPGMNDFLRTNTKYKKKQAIKGELYNSPDPTQSIVGGDSMTPAFGHKVYFKTEKRQSLRRLDNHSELVTKPTNMKLPRESSHISIEEDLDDIDMRSDNSISEDDASHIINQLQHSPTLKTKWTIEDFQIQVQDIESENEAQILADDLAVPTRGHFHHQERKFIMSPLSSKEIEDQDEKPEEIEHFLQNESPQRQRSKSQINREATSAADNENMFTIRRQSEQTLLARNIFEGLPPKQSPAKSTQSKEEQLKRLSKEYQEMLFKHVMSTIKEDDEAPDDYHRQENASPLKRYNRHNTMRKPPTKAKKAKRRLSKIQMGRNLLLNEGSGLHLQWTVGDRQNFMQ